MQSLPARASPALGMPVYRKGDRKLVLEEVRPREARSARPGFRWFGRLVGYGFAAVYALLAVRLLIALFAADPATGSVRLVMALTDPLVAPFHRLLPEPSTDGGYVLALPVVLTIVLYIVLHAAIRAMLRAVGHRGTMI